jgi:hypothetical protein
MHRLLVISENSRTVNLNGIYIFDIFVEGEAIFAACRLVRSTHRVLTDLQRNRLTRRRIWSLRPNPLLSYESCLSFSVFLFVADRAH